MKTLLIPFYDDEAARSALAHALLIAKRFDGHIEGIFIAPSPQVVDAGTGMAMIGNYATHFHEEVPLLAERAKSCFISILSEQGIEAGSGIQNTGSVSASWHDMENPTSHVIGSYGRVFDMIVIGRGYGHQLTDWNFICESALFESGRPVLITGNETDTIGDHIAIAWNQSTETARAVALTMPMLSRAKKVTVLTLDGWSVSGPDGDQLVNGLLRNDINTTLVNIELQGRSPGQAIVEEALSAGADSLIKGAYTQSRLRQFIFGGATRHILQSANLPVIMAH